MKKNKDMESHPTRKELVQFARSRSGQLDRHLQACETCRAFVQAYRLVWENEAEVLERPSDEMIAACQAIPQTVRNLERADRSRGRVSYDSWSRLPAAAVREFPIGQVRYLTWKIGQVQLELVGHREHTGWQFTVRVYVNNEVVSGCSLQVGRRYHLPGAQGFIMWDQARPPRRLVLNIDRRSIELEPVTW